jgi:hypothetical protein
VGAEQHATRERWTPGAGGLMVHRIVPDAATPERVYVAISAAGTFRLPPVLSVAAAVF